MKAQPSCLKYKSYYQTSLSVADLAKFKNPSKQIGTLIPAESKSEKAKNRVMLLFFCNRYDIISEDLH